MVAPSSLFVVRLICDNLFRGGSYRFYVLLLGKTNRKSTDRSSQDILVTALS